MDGDNSKKILWGMALLALLVSPAAWAQLNLGGTAALGNFLNPISVKDTAGNSCNYDLLRIDLAQGKVFARPALQAFQSFRNGCVTTLVEITNTSSAGTVTGNAPPFSNPPTGPISDGVIEVGSFTLQATANNLDDAGGVRVPPNLTVDFAPNTNNTPVIIRATGSVTIPAPVVGGSAAIITISVAGTAGQSANGLLRGSGGAAGPGGYRGGDGGMGGAFPLAGAAGFGPGGGLGGTGGCKAPTAGPKFLTQGTTTVGSTTVPSGIDPLTLLHGGSGGGGGGGCSTNGGSGGGGGGGAILIAANNTITVNGTLTAAGGTGGQCPGTQGAGAGGTGGAIRLVANTITGNGTISAIGGPEQDNGNCFGSPAFTITATGQGGIVRLETPNPITFTGNFGGGSGSQATNLEASVPGSVILPNQPPVFLRISQVTDTGNANNKVALDATSAGSQASTGRTGQIGIADATLPNPSGSAASTVKVDFTVGPCPGFPTGKNVTLVVTPFDAGQGAATAYTSTATIDCNATPHASITSVALPAGLSSLSAFAVITSSASGSLSRMFPPLYEGEEIEAVRLETSGTDTKYVLIAKSGKEFRYEPGR